DQIDKGLLIESERMMNAAFDPREVESERTVVVSEREGNENDPEFLASEELFMSAFRFHPYRWSEGGLKQDLLRITRDDLFDLYVTVWDGVSIDKAEKLLMEEVAKVRRSPPGRHELERAISQIKAQYAYTLDGVARQGFVIGIFEMIASFETMTGLVEKLEK